MIKQHLHFKIPDNIDKKLWRYISLEKLEFLIRDNALYFCRSDLFDDQHEGSYTAKAKEFRKTFYGEEATGWIENTMPKINFNLKKCTYISCWHVNNDENIHMWQSYVDKGKAIAITTTISKIKNYILDEESSFLLGPIHYIDYQQDLVSEGNAFAPFFCKRKEFASEREFRIVKERMIDIDGIISGSIKMPKGINIPIDTNNLIDEVIISPFSDKHFNQKVRELLTRYKMVNKFKDSILKAHHPPIY